MLIVGASERWYPRRGALSSLFSAPKLCKGRSKTVARGGAKT